MPIDPNLPPGGPGGGCQPGLALASSSLGINPKADSFGRVFVAPGTSVELDGSVEVEQWEPDCSHHNYRGAIGWTLSYQAVSSNPPTDVTPLLLNGPFGSPNSFVAGDPGFYHLELYCTELPGLGSLKTKDVFAGLALRLDGSASFWVWNTFIGNREFEARGIHVALVESPGSQQVFVELRSFNTGSVEVTQESADGTFDKVLGVLNLHLVAAISGPEIGNATTDITLSTEGNVTPPGEEAIQGKRVDSDGRVVLVGQANLVGPTGTTIISIQLNGTLTAV